MQNRYLRHVKGSNLVVKHDTDLSKTKLDYYPIEYSNYKVNRSLDYEIAKACKRIMSDRSILVQRVIENWVSLFEEIGSVNLYSKIPFFGRLNFLNRVNLPQCETGVLKFVKQEYPEFSWLPTELDCSDFRKQDLSTVRNFFRSYGFNHKVDPAILLDAIEDTLDEICLPRTLEFKSYDEFVQDMNSRSSSGYPLFLRKGSEEAILEAESVMSILSGETDVLDALFSKPSVVFHRFTPKIKTSEKKVLVKSRTVFGYPMSHIALADMINGKAIDTIMHNEPFLTGLTRPELSERIRSFRTRSNLRCNGILALDISQMDQKLPAAFQLLTHAILMSIPSDSIEPGHLRNLQVGMAAYEVHGPVIGAGNTCWMNNGGTKSGTKYNTLTNSIALTVASSFTSRRNRTTISTEISITNSDDQLKSLKMKNPCCEFEKALLVKRVQEDYQLLGLRIKIPGSKISSPFESVEIMGFDWDIQYRPNRPKSWVIQKICYPEKFRNEKFDDRYVTRSASIMFQIHNGLMFFERLVVKKMGYLQKYIKERINPDIRIYRAREAPLEHLTLPLSELIQKGWRMF